MQTTPGCCFHTCKHTHPDVCTHSHTFTITSHICTPLHSYAMLIHTFTLTPTQSHLRPHPPIRSHCHLPRYTHTLFPTYSNSHTLPPPLSHLLSHTYTPLTHKIPSQVRSDSSPVTKHPRAESIFSASVKSTSSILSSKPDTDNYYYSL